MVQQNIVGRVIWALLICPPALLAIKSKRFWLVFWVLLSFPCLFFLMEYLLWPGGLKRVYHLNTYDKDEVRVVEDRKFLFYKEGYKAKYELSSKYYVPHRILLMPDSKTVPVEYEFKGEILVEIFDKKNKLLLSFKAEKPRNLMRKGPTDNFNNCLIYRGSFSSNPTSVFAFELGEIPFDLIRLKWNRLKNMKVNLTVIKPDKELQDYCKNSTLIIIPDF